MPKSNPKLSVTVDKKTCIRCLLCTGQLPSIFKHDPAKNLVTAKYDGKTDKAKLDEVAKLCPTGSIKVK